MKKVYLSTILTLMLLIALPFLQSCKNTAQGDINLPEGSGPILVPDSKGLDFILSEDGKGYLVSGIGSCTDSFVVVPEKFEELPVIGIAESAFEGNETIESIKLPASIQRIENMAFAKSNALIKISFSEGLTQIGERAFSNCTLLSKLDLPASLKSIGICAFLECPSLETVTFADGSNLTTVEYGCFTSCTALKNVNIPASAPIKDIPSYCFENCTALLGFSCPDSVKQVHSYAFSNCTALSSLHVGRDTEKIDESAFIFCGKITTISVSTENIHFASEGNCLLDAKKTVLYRGGERPEVPNTVRRIMPYAFSGCTRAKIDLPDSVEEIGKGAFEKCSLLQVISIPDRVTSIEQDTFLNCKWLTTVKLPKNLSSVAYNSFYGCTSLNDITLDPGNTMFSTEGKCLTNLQTGMLIVGTASASILPDFVTSIGAHAFEGLEDLADITIPETVSVIEKDAFKNCTGLKNITLMHTSAESLTLREGIFSGCSSLKEILFFGRIKEWTLISDAYIAAYETPWYTDCGRVTVLAMKGDTWITYENEVKK